MTSTENHGTKRDLENDARSPEEIIASIIADGRGADENGVPRVGRATRKKANQITTALRDAGWRILR